LETIKSSSITPKKTAETSEASVEVSVAEAPEQQTGVETGPSEPTKVIPLETEETKIAKATEKMKMSKPILVEEIDTAAPEASSKIYDYIVRHASGKKLSYTASQTTKNYPSVGRWLEVWVFRSLKLDYAL
jgi:hypothetical protein